MCALILTGKESIDQVFFTMQSKQIVQYIIYKIPKIHWESILLLVPSIHFYQRISWRNMMLHTFNVTEKMFFIN